MPESEEKPIPTGEQAPPDSGHPQIDPQRYAALEQFYNQVGPVYGEIEPYLEDVQRFAKDENFRNVSKQAWSAYEAASHANEPDVPEYVKDLKAGQEKLVTYVNSLQEQTAIQNASRQIESLAATYPAISENNYSLLNELQAEAKEVGINTMDGFVTYLRKNAPRYFKQAPAEPEHQVVKTPPRSSRPDGGLPGVPEPKQPVFDGKTPRERNNQRKQYMRSQFDKAVGGGR